MLRELLNIVYIPVVIVIFVAFLKALNWLPLIIRQVLLSN